MVRRAVKGLFSVAVVCGLILGCGDTGGDDDDDIIIIPQINTAPVFSTSTEVDLTGDDTLEVGLQATRSLSADDDDTGSYGVLTYTASAGAPFTISGTTLTYNLTDTGTYNVTVTVTDGGGLSATLSWTLVVVPPVDRSKSHPRIEVTCVVPTGAVHPKFLNKQFVGILYRKIDSTRIELKTHPVITGNFELSFEALVDVGDSIIVDCFIDSLSDLVFIQPTAAVAPNLGWPEPAGRWVLDSVVYDDRGGHGVQFDYRTANGPMYDISDLYDNVVQQ